MLQQQDAIVLDHVLEIFIPTQCICGKNIDPEKRSGILKYVEGKFYDWFGGATIDPVHGVWRLPDESIADEKIDIIESLASQESYVAHSDEVKRLAVEVADRLSQDRVLLKLDGKGFLFARSDVNTKCHHNAEAKVFRSDLAPDARDAHVSLYYSLARFSSLRDARNLFCNVLNYREAHSEAPSCGGWPPAIKSMLREPPRTIADANGFRVVYLHLEADRLRCGAERQVIRHFYHDDPLFHGMFVVSDAGHKEWEFVSARDQGDGAGEFLLRRMRVGTRSVRTAAERLALVQISEEEEKTVTVAELQARHDAAFDAGSLLRRFYGELSDWCAWAHALIRFPGIPGKSPETVTAENAVRLIARLITAWLLKEKGLMPPEIFHKKAVDAMLDHSSDITGSAYYRAILQNLFFATLDLPANERDFLAGNPSHGSRGGYRYARLFKDKDFFERAYAGIPFVGGSLFECLDHMDENGKEILLDCFSDGQEHEKGLVVPDELFFGHGMVDRARHGNRFHARGIISILNSYTFTLEERAPLDEEVALDPEAIALALENLLVSCDTRTGAAGGKKAISFFTPREAFSRTVEESLKSFITVELGGTEEARKKAFRVFDCNDQLPELSEDEIQRIVEILGYVSFPAPICGFSSFSIGILRKMAHALWKLDPLNERWKRVLIERAQADERRGMEKMLEAGPIAYICKLGIILNCIRTGMRVPPVAIQVSRLCLFNTLLHDLDIDKAEENCGVPSLPVSAFDSLQESPETR